MLWNYDPLPVLLFWVNVEQNLVLNGEERCLEGNLPGSLLLKGKFLLL